MLNLQVNEVEDITQDIKEDEFDALVEFITARVGRAYFRGIQDGRTEGHRAAMNSMEYADE